MACGVTGGSDLPPVTWPDGPVVSAEVFALWATRTCSGERVALPVNAVLAGGVLSRFQRQTERFRVGVFFRDCSRYAWRMLLLMVFALFAYWAVFKYVNAGLGGYVDHATLYWRNDRMAFLAHLGAAVLVLLALVFVNLVIDFAQVRIVFGEGSGALESLLASLGFAIARLPRAIVVYAIPSLCGLALLVIYRLITPWHMIHLALGETAGASYEPLLVLALLFIGQQIVMFGRYWFRVATWGSEWSLFAGTRRPGIRAFAGTGRPGTRGFAAKTRATANRKGPLFAGLFAVDRRASTFLDTQTGEICPVAALIEGEEAIGHPGGVRSDDEVGWHAPG